MKIKSIRKVESFEVETDGETEYLYTRYGADSWGLSMGDSEEMVYDCQEIEKLFQEYKRKNGI